MSKLYKIENKKLHKLYLWVYLLPVVGAIPALWTLYRDRANSEQKKASRMSLVLLSLWLVSYISLLVGADRTSDVLSFRLLYGNALITTGYFLICFVLLFRLKQGKSPYLSLINSFKGRTKNN